MELRPQCYSTETNSSYISPDKFPSPDRVMTFAEPLTDEEAATVAERREFSNWQARVASGALDYLQSLQTPTATDWEALYELVVEERADLKLLWKDRRVAQSNRNIQTLITDDSPNQDRVGDTGRFRVNPNWDEATQMWTGGEQTPAGEALISAGTWALNRFASVNEAGDVLQNKVSLPDGQKVLGNQIVRGSTATRRLVKLKENILSRGIDVGHFETGGDIILLVSATESNRATIFNAVMHEFAKLAQQNKQCSREEFMNLVYLLFQSPKYKRGSDSVIRVFAAAASVYLTGEMIVLPKDVDLRAATMTQNDFVDDIA
jgi:hypothetical protein